jgi:hypothetical protein
MTKLNQDDDDQIKDGQTLRVPQFMMDSTSTLDKPASDHGRSTGGVDAHAPGSLATTDADRERRAELYQSATNGSWMRGETRRRSNQRRQRRRSFQRPAPNDTQQETPVLSRPGTRHERSGRHQQAPETSQTENQHHAGRRG